MKQVVIKFGLISGLVLIFVGMGVFLLTQKMGMEHSLWVGYASMVVSFSVVYFGVRSYRDNHLQGRISFGKAFQTGILISLITCVCYVVAWEIMYFGGMVGDFEKTYSEQMIAKAKASGASQAKIDSTAAEMQKFAQMYRNPFYNSAMTFLEPLPVALLTALITAFALSRRKKGELANASGMTARTT